MRVLSISRSVVAALALIALTGPGAEAKIINTPHDFSPASWSNGEICKPCHIPHDASATVTAAPLWNHEVTNATFTVYSSPTMDALPGQPSGVSKLCLSCHDGTIGLDAFGGQSGTVFMSPTNYAYRGTNLADDHPISFTYDTALANADGELFDPATTPSGLGGTIANDILFNDRVECSSCHDVHVSRGDGTCMACHFPNRDASLRKDNTGSALCLTCHDK